MSKNWIAGDVGAGVSVLVDLDAGALNAAAGDIVPVDASKGALLGYLVTPIGTQAGPNAVGVGEDQAVARLLPTEAVVELEVEADPGEPVFVTISNSVAPAYGTVNGSHEDGVYHVGHAVAIPGRTPTTGHSFVYLGTAGSVPPVAGAS